MATLFTSRFIVTDGEIRKVDLTNGKFFLNHGDIKRMAESINGQMWVDGIEAAK